MTYLPSRFKRRPLAGHGSRARLAVMSLALMQPCWVWANGTFQTVRGDVQVSGGTGPAVQAAVNGRLVEGQTVTTAAGAQAVIRMEDGHTFVIHENTSMLLSRYRFESGAPQADGFVVNLVRGALRSVTGLLGNRSRSAFSLTTPSATLGIRGTDFMVHTINPAFVSVISGAVNISNAAGSLSVAAGGLATAAGPGVLATTITAGALPGAVAASFSSLSSVAVAGGAAGAGASAGSGAGTGGAGTGAGAGSGAGAAGGAGGAGAAGGAASGAAAGGAGAAAATGAGVGGLTAGTLAAGAAAAAVAATALTQQSTSQQSTSGTTGTTGTTGPNAN